MFKEWFMCEKNEVKTNWNI